MAAVNAMRRPHHFEPPPSSILASRLVNGDDALELNQASFNQLLAESLGNDDSGQPNLGSDISVNLKVIEIILKAGIDVSLRDFVENPFRTDGAQSKSNAQFLTCLEVVRTAIERSPDVLLANTSMTGKREAGVEQPLYVVLIPRLFSSLIPQTSAAGIASIRDTFLTCLRRGDADSKNIVPHNPVVDLVLGCISGKTAIFSPFPHND
jgi:hypothetical protein